VEAEVIALRREFHQNPELGFEEVETANRVAAYLRELGIEVQTGVGKTGVVGLLQGGQPGPVIALRADLDALPITEKTGVEYVSQCAGKMHACGHDGHTAILMGTAKVLSQLKQEIKGAVKFIFQPAEEGPGGALPMIEEGVLENPKVDAIFGLHIWPGFKTGEIGLGYGAVMAAPDQFVLKIIGKGGHGSQPHETVDAIAVTAQVISSLQQVVSRQIVPTQPVVLTIGTIHGGYRHNVIADEVEMTGTVRTLSPIIRDEVPQRMEEVIKGITSAFGATYELQYTRLYPPVINDQKMAELVEEVGRKTLGATAVVAIEEPTMGGEDFAYFLEKIPGAFFRLGCSNGPETNYPLHHPQFNLDEAGLIHGVKVLCNLVFDYQA
jgi:amidohydrolase